MPLVEPDTAVPPDELRRLYQEHREAIVGLSKTLGEPPTPVVDQARWMNACSLSADLLKLLPEDASAIPSERMTEYVNASYDLMVTLIDLYKLALGLPRVPGYRK